MSFWNDLTGKTAANAARQAAADQYGKQVAAAGETRAAGNQYLEGLLGLSGRFNPYAESGNAALQRLMQGLGLSGPGGSEEFTRAYQALPGYQSGLDTGTKAVTARLNAGPGMQSGAAMKALQRYGSDYENQRSGDYLQRLMGLTQAGMAGTEAGVNTATRGYGGKLGADMGAAGMMFGGAGTIGQGDIAAAQARSAGTQNLMNAGANLFGRFMPSGGFGSSFQPTNWFSNFNQGTGY